MAVNLEALDAKDIDAGVHESAQQRECRTSAVATLVSRFPGGGQATLDRSFLTWAAVLTVACLWPIWWYRFLPMQDYPQHLFIAHVLSTFDSPNFDWRQNYELNSGWGAYTLTYGLLRLFATFTTIEAAGKLLTSLYVLLMAVVVLRAARYHSDVQPPWALLLIFPFIFNQTYFLGFESYLLSIPLLFLALMDLDHLASHSRSVRSAVYQAGILALLFLTHPFSVLTYLFLGLVMALFHFPDRAAFKKMIIPIGLVAAVFVAWYAGSTPTNAPKYNWEIDWWPAKGIAAFYFVMFTGMRWFNGINIYATTLWAAFLGLLLFFAIRDWKQLRVSTPLAVLLALTLLGYLFLPYWIGYYAFFNLRLAPVSYLLLAWIFTSVRVPHIAGHVCAALAMGLVAVSVNVHAKISAETEQLVPLLAKMEKNSAVFPLLIDSGTTVIDPAIFLYLHANDHYYYHVLVGGGVNPSPFPNPMLPLHLRQNHYWPTSESLEQVPRNKWQQALSGYRYVLVRADNSEPIQRWFGFATLVERSGPWTLLEISGTIVSH